MLLKKTYSFTALSATNANGSKLVPAICRKIETLHSHLQCCPLVHPDIKLKLNADKANKENIPVDPVQRSSSLPVMLNKWQTELAEHGPPPKKMCLTLKLPADRQQEFEADMCKMFASCGWAWNLASNPQFHGFFSKWIPEAHVPD